MTTPDGGSQVVQVDSALVRRTRHPVAWAEVLGGLRLRYIDLAGPREPAGPPLVLLHGLASRIEEYDELIPTLSSRRRLVVLDLPGNGYSDKPDRPYSLGFLEDAVLALLDHLGIRHAHVGGGSLGGNLTLRLGRREPERFTRLAPWAPGGSWEAMKIVPWFMRAFMGQWSFWPTVWVQSRYWYNPTWPGRERALREGFAHFREVYGPGFCRMYWDLSAEQLATSLFPIAKDIRQPTLLSWGDQDHGLGMAAGCGRLATMLPNARHHVFAGARHSLANEVPGPLGRIVDEFFVE